MKLVFGRVRWGLVVEVGAPILLLLAWGWATRSGSSFYFPPLTEILVTFRETWLFDRVGSDVVPSLTRLAVGYMIAVSLGISVGLVIGWWPLTRRMADPIIEFLRALPPPTLIPFGILVLGVGNEMKVFVIVIGSIWPILLNTVDGVRGVDPVLLDTARTFKIPGNARFRQIILPAAAPQIMAGMRTALSIALILMVVSELVASTNGIGYFVLEAQRSFRMASMWAGILLLGILGYLCNLGFVLFERRALRWHRGARAASDSAR